MEIRPANLRRAQGAVQSESGYKGVCFDRARQKWIAHIGRADNGNRQKFLGRFSRVEDAAQAYDIAAVEMYGEAARLNFPLNGEKKVLVREDRLCHHGHPIELGQRICLTCKREQGRMYMRRKRAALRCLKS